LIKVNIGNTANKEEKQKTTRKRSPYKLYKNSHVILKRRHKTTVHEKLCESAYTVKHQVLNYPLLFQGNNFSWLNIFLKGLKKSFRQ